MFTEREIEILVAYGQADFQIPETAKAVHLSQATVKCHLTAIRRLMNKPTSPSAYLAALSGGYLSNRIDFQSFPLTTKTQL
jgi:DNA-binding NarL/FixJ family response regulator